MDKLPTDGTACISSITAGELKLGVLMAQDVATQSLRLDTWRDALETYTVLYVDETVANTWAEYDAAARHDGRSLTMADALIASTAATHGLTLITQDRGFEWYADLDVLVV